MTFQPTSNALAPFRTLPALTSAGSVSLAKALLERVPEQSPAYVLEASARLALTVEEIEQALTRRLGTRANAGLERAFDFFVDRLWIYSRGALEFWSVYEHPGVGLLAPAEQEAAKIELGRQRAVRARELHQLLFGGGVDFLSMSYPDQAAHMASRLRALANDEALSLAFDELVGAMPATLLRVCQGRYEAMVTARSTRDTRVAQSLHPLRAKLRLAAETYAALLLSTLFEADEAWTQTVLEALRPMTASGARALVQAAELLSEDAASSESEGGPDEPSP